MLLHGCHYRLFIKESSMDLISREALLNIFEERMHDDNVMCPIIKVLDVLEIVDDAPTVEAKEVVHGKWIKNKQNPEAMQAFHELGIGKGMGINSIYWTCSKCGSWGTPTSNFCSNCGCDMRTSAE